MDPRAPVLALVAALLAGRAEAASLTVYTGGSLLEPLKAVAADYGRATGNSVAFTAATTGVLLNRIHAGEKPDVIVISAEAMEQLGKEGRVAAAVGGASNVCRPKSRRSAASLGMEPLSRRGAVVGLGASRGACFGCRRGA